MRSISLKQVLILVRFTGERPITKEGYEEFASELVKANDLFEKTLVALNA